LLLFFFSCFLLSFLLLCCWLVGVASVQQQDK
jgi:hypothetical protein